MASTATDRIDGLSTTTAIKAPVKAVAITNITLSGAQTVNGTAVVAEDRVLATAQTSAIDNGIYVVKSGAWTRAKDFNGNRDVRQGTLVNVGTGGNIFYRLTTADPVTIGTSSLAFSPTASLAGTITWTHVDDGDAAGDGTTDDTAAITASGVLGAATGNLFFAPKTYRIWPTATTWPQTLCSFSDEDGIVIDGQGATLAIQDTFASGESGTIFSFNNCKNVTIRNFVVTGPTDLVADRGYRFAQFQNACQNIKIENIHQTGGLIGIVCDRALATQNEATKCSGITMLNWVFEDCSYPLSFQNSGDHVFARGIKIGQHVRSYFPYGVRNHDIEMETRDGNTSPSVLLSPNNTDATSNYLENIRLVLTRPSFETAVAPNIVGINFGHDGNGTASNIYVRNIDITINTKYNDTAALHNLVTISKTSQNPSALPDTTGSRGHVLEGLTIRGTVYNENDGAGVISLGVTAQGNWTGEKFTNVAIRDFVVTGTAGVPIHVGKLPWQDALVLENCNLPNAGVDLIDEPMPFGIIVKNSRLGGVYYGEGYLPSIATGTFTDNTYGTTKINASAAAATITLPDGSYPGQRKTFVFSSSGNVSTLTVSNHETSTDEVFTWTNAGELLELEWTGTVWITIRAYGVSP